MIFRVLAIPLLIGIGIVLGYVLAVERMRTAGSVPTEPSGSSLTRFLSGDTEQKPPDSLPDQLLNTSSGFDRYHRIYEFAAGLDEPDLRTEIHAALANSSSFFGYETAKILMTRYLALSPAAAIEFVTSQLDQKDPRYLDLLRVMFREVALVDQDLTVQAIASLGDVQQQYLVLGDLMTHQLVSDKAQFRRRLPEIAASMNYVPDSTVDAGTSPAESFRKALDLESYRQQLSALRSATMRWARDDPEAALQAIENLDSYQQKETLIGSLLMDWAQRDANAALAAAQGIERNNVNRIVSVLGIMARQNPEGALAAAEQLGGRYPGFPLISSVVNGWAQSDPRAAAAYVESLPQGSRDRLVANVANHYQMRDPREALLWALKLDLPEPGVVSMLSNRFAQQDSEGVMEIADSLVSDSHRKVLLTAVAQARSRLDPTGTLSWIEQFQGEEAYQGLELVTVSQWAFVDPRAAVTYVQDMEPSPHSEQLFNQITQTVINRDTTLAAELINDMPSGRTRDQASSLLASRVAMTDIEQSAQIIEQIDDEQIRHRALVNSVVQVLANNPLRTDELLSRFQLEDDPQIRNFLERRLGTQR